VLSLVAGLGVVRGVIKVDGAPWYGLPMAAAAAAVTHGVRMAAAESIQSKVACQPYLGG
jgi:hypothetical protein